MNRDFTLKKYKELLLTALDGGYVLTSYQDYILNGSNYSKAFILRHDVDDRPLHSLQTAMLEKELSAKGSYYFRIVKKSFQPGIIQTIANMGHEIGYHYEDIALAKGNLEKAFQLFKKNLEKVRKYYPVKTICMHGSPLSKWDNRILWKKYNYREMGIIGEPYFDIDFNKVFYITDTGRNWNKSKSSIRDKVNSNFNFNIKSTADVITLIKKGKLPSVIMLNIHPQRWTDNYFLWTKEYILQSVKNIVKRQLVKNKLK